MTLDRPSISSLVLHQSHPSSMSRSHGRSRRSRFYPSLTRRRLHGRNTKGVKIERRTLYVDGSILSTPMWIRKCIRSATSSAHGSQSQGRCCPWRITILLSCCSRCCFTCSATELEAAARGEGRVKCKAQVVVLENKKTKETRLETFSSHLLFGWYISRLVSADSIVFYERE